MRERRICDPLAPVQSKRDFCPVVLTQFRPKYGPGSLQNKDLKSDDQNVPKVLGNVLGILADDGLNVIDMVNKSRSDIAYNIVDVEGDLDPSLSTKIGLVSGVKGVKLFSPME